jgi:hypothetical protein
VLCCKMILKQKVNKVVNKYHFDVFPIYFKLDTQSNNLKGLLQVHNAKSCVCRDKTWCVDGLDTF